MKSNVYIALQEKQKQRIWELDFIRGLCICLMLMDHTFFDLAFYFKTRWFADGETSGFLYSLCDLLKNGYFGLPARDIIWYLAVFCFVFVSGLSSALSHSNLKRGIALAIVALGLSGGTFLLDSLLKQENVFAIRFGILHMLACSILLYYVIHKFDRRFSLSLAIAVIVAGVFFDRQPLETELPWLRIFISTKQGFFSADYFPLFPWFGYFVLGALVGAVVYEKRLSLVPKLTGKRVVPTILFIGRNSLWFYLFHQPIIYLLLLCVGAVLL